MSAFASKDSHHFGGSSPSLATASSSQNMHDPAGRPDSALEAEKGGARKPLIWISIAVSLLFGIPALIWAGHRLYLHQRYSQVPHTLTYQGAFELILPLDALSKRDILFAMEKVLGSEFAEERKLFLDSSSGKEVEDLLNHFKNHLATSKQQ